LILKEGGNTEYSNCVSLSIMRKINIRIIPARRGSVACIDRRQFLTCSCFTTLALFCGNILFVNKTGASMADDNYYLAQKNRLMNEFKKTVAGASQSLASTLGPERTAKMAQDALTAFEALIPGLPNVGGDKNLIAYLVPVAAWYVALYGALRKYGKTAEDTGKLLYDLDEAEFKATPDAQKKMMSERMFSPKYKDMFRDWASWTQKRELRSNWVARFVEGRGGDFDYGCDYVECAMVKYVTSQKVPELAPYICPADFPSSKAYDSGLVRTKTIATGDGVCDFRYKKGRAVTQNWSTEMGRIRGSRFKVQSST
jgi:hypothetical protein